MAKRSNVVRNERRKELVARYAQKRAELKETIRTGQPEEVAEAVRKLSKLPRDSSPSRVRNRDSLNGRPRAHLRKFGLSRLTFRQMAHKGELPGVRKASW